MRALSPDAEDYFKQLFSEYLQVLEQDHNITTIRDYLEYTDATGRLKDPEEIYEYVETENIGLSAFLECPTLLDQDIVYASMNPAMKGEIHKDEFNTGQYGRIHSCGGDVEEIAWKWAQNFDGYLKHSSNPGPRKIIELLQASIDSIPSQDEIPYEEYVTVDSRGGLPNSYYGDVYHTQFFRLPSPEGGFLDEFDDDYWRKKFAQELELADPELFIAGCKDAWLTILNHVADDPDEDIIPHRDSEITTNYSNRLEGSACYSVFELPKKDLWVVTSYHESRYSFLRPERLKENLGYVNQKLTSG